jgi:peptide-methionine (S)-S-oxide reductase
MLAVLASSSLGLRASPLVAGVLRGGGATRARMMFDVFSVRDAELISPDKALPGRTTPMSVPDRHYVLGNKMKGPWPEGHKVAVFANGCFWGSEKGVWRLPGDGIYTTAVGYAAGFTPNPTYEEACSGRTGHTEAVQVVYDPEKISFVDILRWFWEAHDPCAGMGQGNDRGTQ